MANKKPSKKRDSKQSDVPPRHHPPDGTMHTVRETLESIVIAFVLAFLFRTFEAEAFVIPTGSMSPSLQGRHKDVDCSECGYRFRVSASDEEGENAQAFSALLRSPNANSLERQSARANLQSLDTVGGICPMCRQTMPMRSNLPEGPDGKSLLSRDEHSSYPGDRILVNKYGYFYNQPERWDVVVFKFPGNGEMNYIKRLVGLPGERLRIYQGDIFTQPTDGNRPFAIQRKPAEKVAAMLQPVHDSAHESSLLYRAGWPLRWSASEDSGWQVEVEAGNQTVEQSFRIEAGEDGEADWLRYRHYTPSSEDWTLARKFDSKGDDAGIEFGNVSPQLILDFNSYNSTIPRGGGAQMWVGGQEAKGTNRGIMDFGWNLPKEILDTKRGANWVGDLAIDCELEVEEASGELLLDLVEGGKHFTCTIDLQTGEATLSIEGLPDFQPQASTTLKAAGDYEIRFANVDDQLLVWIDGDLVDFGETAYEVEAVFGERDRVIPRSSDSDLGDLSPVGIAGRGTILTVNRLQVLRDIYYIAVEDKDTLSIRMSGHDYVRTDEATTTDNGEKVPRLRNRTDLFRDPQAWTRFMTRRHRDFDIEEDQFFVMGDNSPASLDCRLWSDRGRGTYPGGPYLDRRLLTGKAVCVFWPHSWGGIPGLPFMPGFPNFRDMRIVR